MAEKNLFGFSAVLLFMAAGIAEESPTSAGPVSLLDTPIFRIPMMRAPPQIDGKMEGKEWEDSSAFSAFWYDYNMSDFRYLAPAETQVQVSAAFDQEHLYLAYRSPVYPASTWMKARARFPDVIAHPLYGLQWDDHIELEIRPYHDATRGYTLGLFKWFVNPIGTYSDQLWTLQAGEGMKWKSAAKVRCGVTPQEWTIEIAIPLQAMKTDLYAGNEENGQPLVVLPPPDETGFRVWFTRGIGGNGEFFNCFDKHVWNTTKTKMILDSQAPSFQVNDLGPLMDDHIDLTVTAKNHNTRSETVRVGFFVESAGGLIYSSYEDPATRDGRIELVPGEVRQLRLKKKFPGISQEGNVLWFDVRSAAVPAKAIFQTRLIDFHAQDLPGFRERRIDNIARLRPPKVDFDFQFIYSPTTRRLSAIVDRGIHGASEEAKRAVEAKLALLEATGDESVVAEFVVPFRGDFATLLTEPLDLKNGPYKVSLLLFDANQRIVGERNPDAFSRGQFEWEKNALGRDDVVWEPFRPIEVKGSVLETLRHRVTVDATGLPAQIEIQPEPRELPLELRAAQGPVPPDVLAAIGRGPQLRAPLRLEVQAGGQRIPAQAVEPARITRSWKSETEFTSRLQAGPLDVDLVTQYDVDGSLTARLTYGSDAPAPIEAFEMLMDVAGPVDLRLGEQGSGTFAGMAPTGGFELSLPAAEGVVWDSAVHLDPADLYYSRFVPFFFFGNGDRGFTWVCDSDRGWVIDRAGSTMTLERDQAGQVTWRVRFVNHPAAVTGRRSIEFLLLVHPAKPKSPDARRLAWFYGSYWDGEATNNALPNNGPGAIDGSDLAMELFRQRYPKNPPRLYINNWGNVGLPEFQKNAYTGEWLGNHQRVDSTPMDAKGKYGQPWTRPGAGSPRIEFGASWEDFTVYHLERQIRLAGVQGWWWDETFPPLRAHGVASGGAYFRNPDEVKADELPIQSNFASLHCRSLFKRLARLFKANGVANRTYLWANNSATLLESTVWDTQLIEGAAAYVNSFELDNITAYPISLFRYMAHPFTGLHARITSNLGKVVHPGDDKRLDRGILGRALLHDIGVEISGLVHTAEAIRVIRILHEFGAFEEADTEFIPYWRSRGLVRYGEAFREEDAFALTTGDPYARVYVSVYRRPFQQVNNRRGYQALFIIQNESEKPVRSHLTLLQPDRLLGGVNNLDLAEVRGALSPPPLPQGEMFQHVSPDSFKGISLRFGWEEGSTSVLKDPEDGDVVARGRGGEKMVRGEVYGPLYVPPHNFRIVYGRHDPGKK
ncbi:MAG: hypothetical protein HYU36_21145 [Planctomycetes bacterium]|nr:hypothetical protein [Planctomycetota bacterium]